MRNKSDEILLGYTNRSTNDAIKKSFKDPTYETQISWLRHAQNHAHDFSRINEIKNQYKLDKIKNIVEGGKERQDSVYNGLMSIKKAKNDDIILVHNGSNPLVKENEIPECINAAKQFDAAVCAFPLKDTIKKINNGFVEKTLNRKNIHCNQKRVFQ